MIETIMHGGKKYPKFQGEGFAAQFAIPFAKHVCKGKGYDIGPNRPEWSFPGSIMIDPILDPKWEAYNLPDEEVDYIFSSHCLEHLKDWVGALNYWQTKLKDGGVLFLYLPHPSQTYWRPWNNRKHIHSLYPDMIQAYLADKGWSNIFVTEADLNHSFMAVAEKNVISDDI